jgi:hypothetical protein
LATVLIEWSRVRHSIAFFTTSNRDRSTGLDRKAGFKVSNSGYFLYVNGSKQGGFYSEGTHGVMNFATTLIAYDGNDSWVDAKIVEAMECYQADELPQRGSDCDNCRYFEQRAELEMRK